MRPLFSVIIPTHNRPEGLRRALQSIAMQNFSGLEVIIINDASSLDYAEVIEHYSGIISNYSFLTTNVGVSSARNKGIEIASGEWIAFLDDDDEFAEHHFARLSDYVKNNKLTGSDFVWCKVEKRTYSEQKQGYRASAIKPLFYAAGRKVRLYESAMSIGASFGLTINAEILSQIGYFDPALKVGEDTDLILRLLVAGAKPNYFDNIGIIKHDHLDGRLTEASYAVHSRLNIYETLLEKHRELLEKYPLFTKFFISWACICHYRNGNYQRGDLMAKSLSGLAISTPEKLLFGCAVKTYKGFLLGNLKVAKVFSRRSIQ